MDDATRARNAELRTRMVVLRGLTRDLGWRDASDDQSCRLVSSTGMLGLVVDTMTLVFVDPGTSDPVNLKITGGWSYGSVVRLIQHLEIVDSLRRVGKGD
jgi:hypothetical protein